MPATGLVIWGIVKDAGTGLPIDRACITVGPPIRCDTYTDPNGKYLVDLAADGALPNLQWELFALRTTPEPKYATTSSGVFRVNGVVQKDFSLPRQ